MFPVSLVQGLGEAMLLEQSFSPRFYLYLIKEIPLLPFNHCHSLWLQCPPPWPL